MIEYLKKMIKYLFFKVKFSSSKIAFSTTISVDKKIENNVCILKNAKLGACKISKYTYIGTNCQIERTSIGPFTSIGPDVICGVGIHPLNFISTYPGFYTSKTSGATWFGTVHKFEDKKGVIIGADVWIGTRAIIMGGVRIGNGAVIGAGAIVTKDVPDYSIVVGIPAKIIKYRFNPDLIKLLIESKWWDKSEIELVELAKYIDNPDSFLKKLKNEEC